MLTGLDEAKATDADKLVSHLKSFEEQIKCKVTSASAMNSDVASDLEKQKKIYNHLQFFWTTMTPKRPFKELL